MFPINNAEKIPKIKEIILQNKQKNIIINITLPGMQLMIKYKPTNKRIMIIKNTHINIKIRLYLIKMKIGWIRKQPKKIVF